MRRGSVPGIISVARIAGRPWPKVPAVFAGRDVVGPAHADHGLGARHQLERAERVGLEAEELGEHVLVAQALAGSESDRVGLDGLGVVLAAGQPLEGDLGLLRPGVVDLDVGLEEGALGAGRHRRRRDEALAGVRSGPVAQSLKTYSPASPAATNTYPPETATPTSAVSHRGVLEKPTSTGADGVLTSITAQVDRRTLPRLRLAT